jgi:hypothetical protein
MAWKFATKITGENCIFHQFTVDSQDKTPGL